MDIEDNSSYIEESEISNSENEEIESINEVWLIPYGREKEFWLKALYTNHIYTPELCPACKKGQFEKKQSQPLNIVIPFYLICNFNKCRKKVHLRVFKLFPNTSANIIYLIIELFLIKRQNGKEIYNEIKSKYNKNITYLNICRKLKIIAEFFKIKYR